MGPFELDRAWNLLIPAKRPTNREYETDGVYGERTCLGEVIGLMSRHAIGWRFSRYIPTLLAYTAGHSLLVSFTLVPTWFCDCVASDN
jgi:hypothetical protein